MKVKHKLRIWSRLLDRRNRRLWYVSCDCKWEPDYPAPYSSDVMGKWFGRSTHDAALALGVAHQKDKMTGCAWCEHD